MVHEAKRDAEVDKVSRVFGDYIKESPYLDWLWSDKLGYVLMQISFEGEPCDHGGRKTLLDSV